MIRAFKYKLKRPGKSVIAKFENHLALCRELYNAALQERRDAYILNKISLNYYDQANQLSEIKQSRGELKLIHSQVLQDTLRRVDKSFKSFFSRIKKGANFGFPRFKGKNRFKSFRYPQSGFELKGDKLKLSKIGTVRIRLSRDIEGKISTVTIIKDVDGWYVVFTVETEKCLLKPTGEAVGVDMGLESFVTLSNGEQIKCPQFLRNSESGLKRIQRAVARKKKGSQNREKLICRLQKKHLKIKRQRQDFLHKTANSLIERFDEIAVEQLGIRKMIKSHHFAKSIVDASWGYFLQMLDYKAENAGKKVCKVDPHGTSQTCICGEKVKKDLSIRLHKCPKCGLSMHRDIVAAKVILMRAGQTRKDVTYAVG